MEGVPTLLPLITASPMLPSSGRGRLAPVIPPPGPVWFPSVMGTGILSTLLAQHVQRIPGAFAASLVALLVCWVLLVGLSVSFIIRGVRRRGVFREALTSPAIVPFWGTVSMGFLSVGSATATTLPLHVPSWESLAWSVNAVLWMLGVTVGLLSAFSFGARMVGSGLGEPSFVWGLAVVGPMVAATAGAHLSAHVSATVAPFVLLVSMACFVVTFSLGWAIFIQAYYRAWWVAPVPLIASASTWIPLGLVGQSSAAAQAFARRLPAVAEGPVVGAMGEVANAYGWAMFAIGTPLTVWAAYVTVRGFTRRMPFSPGWWATTFPIGTMALGSTAMSAGTGVEWLAWVGALNTVILVGTVTLSTVGSVHAIFSRYAPTRQAVGVRDLAA